MKVLEKKYDVIVLGGGSMGTAAAYYLAKENKKVMVIDQFSIPNHYGSHHGHTRMLRLGNGNGGKYVPFGKESLRLWKELEEISGKTLFNQLGALTVGHRQSTFVKEAIKSSINHDVVYEEMDAKMIMDRWPGIKIPDDYYGCFDPESGFLFSEECIQTYKEEAMKLGADVIENQPVVDLEMNDDQIILFTANGQYTASKLVVTAGAWLPKLLPSMSIPIKPLRKTIGWFKPTVEKLYSEDFPCFIFDTNTIGHYYGFPDFDGGGVKLGRMDLGYDCDPDTLNRDFGAYEDDEYDIRNFLEHFLPGASGELLKGATSMFSMTPDADFIVDVHPEYENVCVAGGFSGHGFKFASVIGKILTDLSIRGETEYDISFLRLNRFSELERVK
ncbi:N-methyl-L-tryptophan oxidase [Aquibacillus albus]|uniref:Monomeric sarcosine oxidase n=1 Tax=Aquibacillus albus TaxID=1168171 RepID=A0ABS2MWE6_9BACI|nr:N-methyl-L-tryptophan oxidase [Aquibacillus albus]MBM7570192.1 monomeric sarcosine oxidase [Aquibacillus albus]